MSTSQNYDVGENYANSPTILAAVRPAIVLDSPESIKVYFEYILRLANSGEKYPAKLSDVWPLAYSAKHKAVAFLKKNFFKVVDYQLLNQTVENSKGGRPEEDYQLTVACLEYLVARKVRKVFEVYRKVFHKAFDKTQHELKEKLTALIGLVNDQTERLIGLEGKIDRMNRARVKHFKAVVDNRHIKFENHRQKAQKEECRNLFELFAKYMRVHSYQTGDTVMDSLLYKINEYFGIDLKRQHRSPGEHYFEVAVRLGLGHVVEYGIKCHMSKSGDLR